MKSGGREFESRPAHKYSKYQIQINGAKLKMAAKKKTKTKTCVVEKHFLIPKHSKLSEKDKKSLFEKYHIDPACLPKILASDPAIINLGLKPGDIVKIERESPTSGKTNFYRCVIDG